MGSALPDMISWNTSPNNFCNVLHLPSLPMLLIANVFMPSCRSTLSGVGWGGVGWEREAGIENPNVCVRGCGFTCNYTQPCLRKCQKFRLWVLCPVTNQLLLV